MTLLKTKLQVFHSDRTPPVVHQASSLFMCVWTSLNGNQVLLCSARAGLLLQLRASRSSLTSSPGGPTSNAPLMADKVIGLGRLDNKWGEEGGIKRKRKHFLLWMSIQNPGQLFSLDAKRKQAAALWESYKKSNRLLVKAAGKRRIVRGLMTDG